MSLFKENDVRGIARGYEKLNPHLVSRGQKAFEKGELILLAKALADVLPLLEMSNDLKSGRSVLKEHVAKHRYFIDSALYTISCSCFLSDQAQEEVRNLTEAFVLWRHSVAYATLNPIFVARDRVIDDLSGLPVFLDCSQLAYLSDVAGNATHMYVVFKEIATERWFSVKKDQEQAVEVV